MSTLDEILGTSPSDNGKPQINVNENADDKPKDLKPVSTVETSSTKVELPEHISYADMYEQLSPKPKYDEEKEKKRRKREELISAIGDGLTAISDMFFASKGAKGVSKADGSLSKGGKDRWDKLKEEREKNLKAWQEGYIKALTKDDEWAKWKVEQARKDNEFALKEAKDKRQEKLDNLKVLLYAEKISTAEYEAKIKEIDAKYEAELKEIEKEKGKSTIKVNNERADFYGSGAGYGRSSSKYEFDGKLYPNKEMYEQAVYKAVIDWNKEHPDNKISLTEVKTRVTDKGHGRTSSSSTMAKRSTKEIRKDYEDRIAAEKAKSGSSDDKGGSSGSSNGGGKKSPTAEDKRKKKSPTGNK